VAAISRIAWFLIKFCNTFLGGERSICLGKFFVSKIRESDLTNNIISMDRKHFYELPPPIDLINDNATYLSSIWLIDARLRRYINNRIPEDYSSLQVLAIAQILVSEVRQLPPLVGAASPPQRGCITALLAYILFRHPELGRKTQNQLRSSIFERLQSHLQGLEFGDIYQTGLELISDPANFLQKFRSELDWYFSLIKYSHNKFLQSLVDELRSKLRNRNLKRSNLSILNGCKSSRLEKLLILYGEKGDRFDGLVTLHQCFQELVIAKEFSTNKPQLAQYDALLTRYRERSIGVNFEIVDREQAKKLLEYLGNSLRNDKQPGVIYLDDPSDREQPETTLGDKLVGDFQPESQRIVVPEHDEIKELALNLIQQHELDLRLLLLYGLDLTQDKAGRELSRDKSSIGKHQNRLLAKIAEELYLTYNKLPPKTNIPIEIRAKHINYIDSICDDYYANLVTEILTEIIESESIQSKIESLFIERLEIQWDFKFKSDGVGASKAAEFVQRRLNLPSFYPDELPM
jgi:hypothetical protein